MCMTKVSVSKVDLMLINSMLNSDEIEKQYFPLDLLNDLNKLQKHLCFKSKLNKNELILLAALNIFLILDSQKNEGGLVDQSDIELYRKTKVLINQLTGAE